MATVNRYGVSPFSDIVTLSGRRTLWVLLPPDYRGPLLEPTPVVPTPFYDLVSAELINETFASHQGDDGIREWNQTVRAIVGFAPPPNWDLDQDIVDVTAEFYPESSGSHMTIYAPQKVGLSWMSLSNESYDLDFRNGSKERPSSS